MQPPTDFVCAGFLEKSASSVLSRWQRRFFVASGHYLRYYRDETEEHLLAAVDLSSVAVGAADGGAAGAGFPDISGESLSTWMARNERASETG